MKRARLVDIERLPLWIVPLLVASLLFMIAGTEVGTDGRYYVNMSIDLYRGEIPLAAGWHLFQPVYPGLLGATYVATGPALGNAFWLNRVLYALAGLLIYWIGCEVAGIAVGLAGSLLYVSAPLVCESLMRSPDPDATMLFFYLAFLGLLLLALTRRRIVFFALAGAALAFSVLAKPPTIVSLLLPVSCVALVRSYRTRENAIGVLLLLVSFGAMIAAVSYGIGGSLARGFPIDAISEGILGSGNGLAEVGVGRAVVSASRVPSAIARFWILSMQYVPQIPLFAVSWGLIAITAVLRKRETSVFLLLAILTLTPLMAFHGGEFGLYKPHYGLVIYVVSYLALAYAAYDVARFVARWLTAHTKSGRLKWLSVVIPASALIATGIPSIEQTAEYASRYTILGTNARLADSGNWRTSLQGTIESADWIRDHVAPGSGILVSWPVGWNNRSLYYTLLNAQYSQYLWRTLEKVKFPRFYLTTGIPKVTKPSTPPVSSVIAIVVGRDQKPSPFELFAIDEGVLYSVIRESDVSYVLIDVGQYGFMVPYLDRNPNFCEVATFGSNEVIIYEVKSTQLAYSHRMQADSRLEGILAYYSTYYPLIHQLIMENFFCQGLGWSDERTAEILEKAPGLGLLNLPSPTPGDYPRFDSPISGVSFPGQAHYLIGWWGFDECSGTIALDATPYGNDGVLHGPTWVCSCGCTLAGEGALKFDGVDDYAVVPESRSLNQLNGMTIAAWLKLDVSSGMEAGEQTIVQQRNTAGDVRGSNYIFRILADRTLQLAVGDGGVTEAMSSTGKLAGQAEWHFVAATVQDADEDGEREIAFYIDGEPAGLARTRVAPLGGGGTAVEWNIGAFTTESGDRTGHLQGTLDELAVYSRALNGEEIRELWTGVAETQTLDRAVVPKLVGSYDVDIASTDTHKDASVKSDSEVVLSLGDNMDLPSVALDEGRYEVEVLARVEEGATARSPELQIAVEDRLGRRGERALLGEFQLATAESNTATASMVLLKPKVLTISLANGISQEGPQMANSIVGQTIRIERVRIHKTLEGDTPATSIALYAPWGEARPAVILRNENRAVGVLVEDTMVSEDEWHHVTVILTADFKLRFYVDGELKKTAWISMPPSGELGILAIGADVSSGVVRDYFGGMIRNLQLFNCALAEREVKEIYEQGRGPVEADGEDTLQIASVHSACGSGTRARPILIGDEVVVTHGNENGLAVTAQGLFLDGIDDYLLISAPAELDISSRGLTVCAWIRPADLGMKGQCLVALVREAAEDRE